MNTVRRNLYKVSYSAKCGGGPTFIYVEAVTLDEALWIGENRKEMSMDVTGVKFFSAVYLTSP